MWSHGRWYIIHHTALLLENDPANFTRWMRRHVVPYLECEKCRNHALKYMQENPVTAPWKWSVDFHNHVNVHKDIPASTISESYARRLITNKGYPASTLYEGIWRSIHSTSCSNTPEDVKFFTWWLPKIIESMPNDTYIRAAKAYIRKNPISFDTFVWAYNFHEALKPRSARPVALRDAVNTWRGRQNTINCPSCQV